MNMMIMDAPYVKIDINYKIINGIKSQMDAIYIMVMAAEVVKMDTNYIQLIQII